MIIDQLSFCVLVSIFSTISFLKTFHSFIKSSDLRTKSKVNDMNTNNALFVPSDQDTLGRVTKVFLFAKSLLNPYLSFNSVLIFIGMISEAYLYGSILFGNLLGISISYIYSGFLLHFFFYDLDKSIKSPYEYLQKRFRNSVAIRVTCAISAIFFHYSFITLHLLSCAVIFKTIYPELVRLWQSALILGVYSLVGACLQGYKQTFKMNFLQFFLYLSGVVSAIFITFFNNNKNRTPSELWQIAYQYKRLSFIQFDKDLRTKHAILNQTLSMPLPWCVVHLLTVANFHRYRSAETRTKSTILHISNVPIMLVISIILLFNAIASFVYFFGCDPIANHEISNKNQIPSYFLLKALGETLPSMAGICLASTFCYGIVFHSSGLVSIADSVVKEVLEPLNFTTCFRDSKWRTYAFKSFVILFSGILSILYAIEFKFIPRSNISILFVINNSINSPIFGLFLLAALNPYANSFGALFGFLTNLALNSWLALGKLLFSSLRNQELPPIVFNCKSNFNHNNQTFFNHVHNQTSSFAYETPTPDYYPKNQYLFYMYSISSKWYCLFSVLFVFVVGSLASLIYSLVKTKSFDSDRDFAKLREKYIFRFNKIQ